MRGACAPRMSARRIAPAVGYVETQHVKLHDQLSRNWGRWAAAVAQAGLEPSDHLGLSRNALASRKASDSELEAAEQEHWVSSAGFVLLLLHWRDFRRQKDQRDRVQRLGNLWLEQRTP